MVAGKSQATKCNGTTYAEETAMNLKSKLWFDMCRVKTEIDKSAVFPHSDIRAFPVSGRRYNNEEAIMPTTTKTTLADLLQQRMKSLTNGRERDSVKCK